MSFPKIPFSWIRAMRQNQELAERKQKFRIHDNVTVIGADANKFFGSSFDGGTVMLKFGTAHHIPDVLAGPDFLLAPDLSVRG